jgi:hypothetical protein
MWKLFSAQRREGNTFVGNVEFRWFLCHGVVKRVCSFLACLVVCGWTGFGEILRYSECWDNWVCKVVLAGVFAIKRCAFHGEEVTVQKVKPV